MSHDVQSAIQLMLQVAAREPLRAGSEAEGKIFAFQGDYASGSDEIAEILAKRLHVPVYAGNLVHLVAERTHTDAEAVKVLDETAHSVRDSWLFGMITGKDLTPGTFKRHLVNVILSLARQGGVFLGRGCHIILGSQAALRVRIVGSPAVCAERVMETEGLDRAAALEKVRQVNHDRGRFAWEMFRVRGNDPHDFDVSFNTDRIHDFEFIADRIQEAAREIRLERELEARKAHAE